MIGLEYLPTSGLDSSSRLTSSMSFRPHIYRTLEASPLPDQDHLEAIEVPDLSHYFADCRAIDKRYRKMSPFRQRQRSLILLGLNVFDDRSHRFSHVTRCGYLKVGRYQNR